MSEAFLTDTLLWWGPAVVCPAAAAAAAWTDLRCHRIYNGMVLPLLLTGLVCQGLAGGIPALVQAVGGAALPLLLLPLFLTGMLGAGDIKLLMALGAWLGVARSGELMVLAVLCGGGMAALMLAWRRDWRGPLTRVIGHVGACLLSGRLLPYDKTDSLQLPFGLAALCGVTLLLLQQAGVLPPLLRF